MVWLVPALALAACQVVVPLEPVATPTSMSAPAARQSPRPGAVVHIPLIGSQQSAATSSPIPAPTPTSVPTPTPTSVPTPMPTLAPGAGMRLDAPLPEEFVSLPLTVSGVVSGTQQGEVRLDLLLPDGQPLAIAPVVATVRPLDGGLAFAGMLALDLPPTPRQALLRARWAPAPQAAPRLEATRLINLPGAAARITEVMVIAERDALAGVIHVQGSAPGPPDRVVVRLLGPGDVVLSALEAQRSWVAPGLPCAFRATLPQHADALVIEALALDAGGTVQDTARVWLGAAP